MSTSNTPTSPAVRQATSQSMSQATSQSASQQSAPQSSGYSVGTFVSLVLVAIVAGVAGALIVQSYPVDWPGARWLHFSASSALFNSGNTSGNTIGPGIVYVDRANDTNGAQLVKLLQSHQTKTVVSVYDADTVTDAVTDTLTNSAIDVATDAEQLADATELGKGIIVSSDGWIAIVSAVLAKDSTGGEDYVIGLHDGRVFTSDQVVVDAYSGVTFVRIPATQLPTADFRTTDPQVGEDIIMHTFSMMNGDRFHFGHLENITFHGVGTASGQLANQFSTQFSTQRVNRYYLVDQAGTSEYASEYMAGYLGGPVFDEQGQMIGLTMADHQVLPINVVSRLLYPIFSDGNVTHHGIDVAYQPVDSGAEITVKHQASSPLKVGDIVTEVNGITIDAEHDLSDVLTELELGQTVDVNIVRGDKQLTIALPIE